MEMRSTGHFYNVTKFLMKIFEEFLEHEINIIQSFIKFFHSHSNSHSMFPNLSSFLFPELRKFLSFLRISNLHAIPEIFLICNISELLWNRENLELFIQTGKILKISEKKNFGFRVFRNFWNFLERLVLW